MKDRIILITGRIGSGKSAVASMLRKRHHCEVSIDEFSKWFLDADCTKNKLAKLFPGEVLHSDGNVNRAFLQENFFKDKFAPQRKKFETFVFNAFRQFLPKYLGKTCEDVPVFVEVHESERVVQLFKTLPNYSRKIVVRANKDLRYERVQQRSGLTVEQIAERDNLQQDCPIEKGDVVISNEGSLETLEKQVLVALRDLLDITDKEREAVFASNLSMFALDVKSRVHCYLYKTFCGGCVHCPLPCPLYDEKDSKQKLCENFKLSIDKD